MQAELKKITPVNGEAAEIAAESPGRDETEFGGVPAETRASSSHQKPPSHSSMTLNAGLTVTSELIQCPNVTVLLCVPETVTSHASPEPVSNPLALIAEAAGAAQALETKNCLTNSSPSSNGEPVSGELLTGEGIGYFLLHRSGYVFLGLQLDRKVLESGIDALFAPSTESDRYSNYFGWKQYSYRLPSRKRFNQQHHLYGGFVGYERGKASGVKLRAVFDDSRHRSR